METLKKVGVVALGAVLGCAAVVLGLSLYARHVLPHTSTLASQAQGLLAGQGGGGGSTTGGTGIVCSAGTCSFVNQKYQQQYTEFCDNGEGHASLSPTAGVSWNYWSQSVSGTNAAINNIQVAGFGTVYSLDTGTTTTGRASDWNNSGAWTGAQVGDTYCVWTLVNIPTLSNGTDTWIGRVGFGNLATGLPNNGAFFAHDIATSATNWLCQNRSGGAGAATDSGVAITPGTAQALEVCLNSTTNVTYSINGTTVCTLASNIPAAGTTAIGAQIIKSAGTTSATLQQRRMCFKQSFSFPRYAYP